MSQIKKERDYPTEFDRLKDILKNTNNKISNIFNPKIKDLINELNTAKRLEGLKEIKIQLDQIVRAEMLHSPVWKL